MDTVTPLAPHGTRARYVHRTKACRCEACRKANARYIARWRTGGTSHRSDEVWHPRQWKQLELIQGGKAP